MEPESKSAPSATATATSNNNTQSKCQVCQETADKVCSGCKSVSYCSVEHQKTDWKSHRKQCQVFTIQSNDQYGRYMVATRDIEPGQVIMNEEPIVVGPKQDTLPICLGCHQLLRNTTANYSCSKCNLPLCGPACEKAPLHADNECRVFTENRVSFKPILDYSLPAPIYECILTLRCLMLKISNPRKWSQLTAMTSQNEARKRTLPGLWYRNQMNTVRTLMGPCRFGTDFSELDIHTVIGYIDINAFEINLKGGYDISGLFNNTYIMSHDCVSNTHHTFTEDMRMVVRASVPIPKGEQITTSYASVLDGTAQRSIELMEAKFFLCKCRRCLDPTELGTYLTAIHCQRCEKGYAIPVQPINQTSSWKCEKCGHILAGDKVRQLVEPIFLEIKAAENESPSMVLNSTIEDDIITRLERVMQKYSKRVLHPNHYLMVQILHSLVSLYGRVPGWLVHDLNLGQLKRMKEICEQLVSILDRIEPGMSRLRGFTLYQLHAALFYITQRETQAKTINKTELKERLTRVKLLLWESHRILSFDGLNTPEGAIAATIPGSIDDVGAMLSELSLTS